jgi:hypothetical protein
MTKQLQKIRESPNTTAAGGVLGFGGLILMFLPTEIRTSCMDSVMNSENPVLFGGIAAVGLLLTVVGPSLKLKK